MLPGRHAAGAAQSRECWQRDAADGQRPPNPPSLPSSVGSSHGRWCRVCAASSARRSAPRPSFSTISHAYDHTCTNMRLIHVQHAPTEWSGGVSTLTSRAWSLWPVRFMRARVLSLQSLFGRQQMRGLPSQRGKDSNAYRTVPSVLAAVCQATVRPSNGAVYCLGAHTYLTELAWPLLAWPLLAWPLLDYLPAHGSLSVSADSGAGLQGGVVVPPGPSVTGAREGSRRLLAGSSGKLDAKLGVSARRPGVAASVGASVRKSAASASSKPAAASPPTGVSESDVTEVTPAAAGTAAPLSVPGAAPGAGAPPSGCGDCSCPWSSCRCFDGCCMYQKTEQSIAEERLRPSMALGLPMKILRLCWPSCTSTRCTEPTAPITPPTRNGLSTSRRPRALSRVQTPPLYPASAPPSDSPD